MDHEHTRSAPRAAAAAGTTRRTSLRLRAAGLRGDIDVAPSEPLWKRVPTRGEDGRPLSDFMMLIPRLRERSRDEFLATVERIQQVFDHYSHAVVFADLNTRLNLLWVSVRPIPGIIPDPFSLPDGCAFQPRCPAECHGTPKLVEVEPGHWVRCALYGENV